MMLIRRFALLILVLVMAACGGSGSADKNRPPENSWESKTKNVEPPALRKGGIKPAQPADQGADLLAINTVKITPDRFFANDDLNAEVEVVPPVPDGIAFEYRWYVNNQPVADASGPVLASGNFRKHQWIICEARAIAGEKTSVWLKSDWVRAADSPPQINPVAVKDFSIPGRFTYQIEASDADNDELSFELISPLNVGIALDKKTGRLTWELNGTIIKKLGESIEIALSVSDNDAPPATGSITLHFEKRTENQNP